MLNSKMLNLKRVHQPQYETLSVHVSICLLIPNYYNACHIVLFYHIVGVVVFIFLTLWVEEVDLFLFSKISCIKLIIFIIFCILKLQVLVGSI